MAENASIQRGLGSAFNALPPETQDGVVRAAGGGILAFQDRGLVDSSEGDAGSDGVNEGVQEGISSTVADPRLQADINRRVLGISNTLLNRQGYVAPKPQERINYENKYVTSMLTGLGPDPYQPMYDYYDKRAAKQQGLVDKLQGAAALKAIPFILQPGGTVRGLGAAAGSLGASAAEIEQAQQVAEDHMMQARMNIANMQRHEKLGLRKEARADYNNIQANLIAADLSAAIRLACMLL